MNLSNICDVLLLMVSMTTLCQGSRIVISAKPATISEGETPRLNIRCYLEDCEDSENPLPLVSSIIISKDEDSTEIEVGSIATGQAAVTGPGARGARVSGDLCTEMGYIQATWISPAHAQSGTYICDILAVDADGIDVKFRSNIQIDSTGPSDSSLAKLVAKIREDVQLLEKTMTDVKTHGVLRDQKAIAECRSQIDDLSAVLNGLKTNISSLSLRHTEQGLVECKLSETWEETIQGRREKAMDVQFSTPYTKKPMVDISVVVVDVNQKMNTRYNVSITDLTATGFKIVCVTWANSMIYNIGVRWTSYVD